MQERERRRLASEEAYRSQVGEANRAAAEAQQGMTAAQASAAELMRQVQSQQREILALQSNVPEDRAKLSAQLADARSLPPPAPLPRHLGEATAMLERERDEHSRAVRALDETVRTQGLSNPGLALRSDWSSVRALVWTGPRPYR